MGEDVGEGVGKTWTLVEPEAEVAAPAATGRWEVEDKRKKTITAAAGIRLLGN